MAPAPGSRRPLSGRLPQGGLPTGLSQLLRSTVTSRDIPRDANSDGDCWARLPSAASLTQAEEGARERRDLESSLFVDTCGGSPVLSRTVAAALWRVPERLAGMLGSPARCCVAARVRM